MPGKYRHRATLEQRSETMDSYGEDTRTYTTLSKVFATLEAVTASERFESQQVQSDVTHRITFRFAETYLSNMGPKDRIIINSRTFEIVSLLDREGRERELEAICVERQ